MKYELRPTVRVWGDVHWAMLEDAEQLSLYKRVPQADGSTLAEWVADFPLAVLRSKDVVYSIEEGA